ncbi:MAG: hypothetical protein V1744_08000 [Candidatus Altiarchaeota archaeon]
MAAEKSALRTVLSDLVGLFVFLILLAVLNVLVPPSGETLSSKVTLFMNKNAYLVVAAVVVYAFGQLFSSLRFPLNLPAPLIKAVAGVTVLDFIFYLLTFIVELTSPEICSSTVCMNPILEYKTTSELLVFLLVAVGGYIGILSNILSAGGRKSPPPKNGDSKDKKREEGVVSEPAGSPPHGEGSV